MDIFSAAILWLHTLAAVAWVGGMVFNLLVLRPSMGVVDPAQRIKLAEKVLKRFIPLVWICIGVLLFTGILLALPKVPSLKVLFGSFYGSILLFKLALVLIMIFIVVIIRYAFLPRLESLIAISSPDVGKVMGQIVSLVKINLGLGVLVLLLTGFLAFS